MLSSLNPLSLPEVRLILSRYLNSKSLKTCALVCKDWHLDFQPSIWERISGTSTFQRVKTPEEMQWLLNSIQKNFVYTRHIQSYEGYGQSNCDSIFPIFMDHSPNLVSVILRTSYHWDKFLEVIRRNRSTLLYLELWSRSQHRTDRDIYNLVAGLSALQVLTINVVDKITGLIQVLAACPSLKELTVQRQIGWDQYSFYDEGSGERDVDSEGLPQLKSHSLQILKMESCNDTNFSTLLAICSKITTLGLRCGHLSSRDNPRELASSPFCHLTTLDLDSDYRGHTSIKDILIALPQHQLRDVKLEGAVDEDIQQLAESHQKSLMVASITSSDKGYWVGHGLASIFSCPLLESITFDGKTRVDIRMIIQEPWNCPNLKVLNMPLALDRSGATAELANLQLEEKEEAALGPDECDQAETVFMRQLGKMTQLRGFIYTGYRPKVNREVEPAPLFLTWRLSHGLGHLADLSQLESLHFGRGSAHPGIDDLEFMKDHWPNFCRFSSVGPYSEEMQDWRRQHWSSVRMLLG